MDQIFLLFFQSVIFFTVRWAICFGLNTQYIKLAKSQKVIFKKKCTKSLSVYFLSNDKVLQTLTLYSGIHNWLAYLIWPQKVYIECKLGSFFNKIWNKIRYISAALTTQSAQKQKIKIFFSTWGPKLPLKLSPKLYTIFPSNCPKNCSKNCSKIFLLWFISNYRGRWFWDCLLLRLLLLLPDRQVWDSCTTWGLGCWTADINITAIDATLKCKQTADSWGFNNNKSQWKNELRRVSHLFHKYCTYSPY